MPTRTLTAEQSGPISIDATLLGAGGIVTVRTDRTRNAAEITIRTADESGTSADTVRDADLRWDPRGSLVARVQGKGGTTIANGGGVFIAGNNYGGVQQVVSNNYGSMIAVSAGDLNIPGGRYQFNSGGTVNMVLGASPVEIIALVPEGSSVIARTQSADVIADGTFASVAANTQSGDVRAPGQASQVTANTQSGDISADNSPSIHATTQSGDIRLGRTDVVEASTMSGDVTVGDFGGTAQLKSTSGDIRVHATAGGDITAKTMSGDVTVSATEQAQNDNLDVRANSMSGSVRIPPHHLRGAGPGPRRRRTS